MKNSSNAIIIIPCNNGFIVDMPANNAGFENHLSNIIQTVVNKEEADPALSQINNPEFSADEFGSKKHYDHIKDTHSFVFDSFEKGLAFLNTRYYQQ